jgi:steroid delta-isomerase-like uncharacterized protein
MSEKHEQVVRRMFDEVWNLGNVDAIPQLITSDYENHDPMNPIKGINATKELVTKYRTAFPDCRLAIDELFSAGDKVVVRWRYSGTHRNQLEGIAPTGRKVNGTGITLYRFSGERIQEAFTNWDALGLMQQLGVVTLPGKATAAGL